MSKTALVTGANKGIGLEVCRQLSASGYRVFLSARNPEKGLTAAKSLNVEFISMDVSNETSIIAAAHQLATLTPNLDVLINNAGIYNTEGMDFETQSIKSAFDTNALGALLTTRAFSHLLEKSPNPQIVNVSTGMSQTSYRTEGVIAYRVSKAALNAITRITSNELYDQTIKVNAACPGWVRTDMGGENATRDVTKGAETIIWLATGGAGKATGKFFRDHAEIEW